MSADGDTMILGPGCSSWIHMHIKAFIIYFLLDIYGQCMRHQMAILLKTEKSELETFIEKLPKWDSVQGDRMRLWKKSPKM
jgi:hypothetical protein